MPLDIPFVQEFPNALSSEFCRGVIEKFDQDDRKYPGMLGDPPRLCESVKTSIDLHISSFSGYEMEDKVFFESLQEHLPSYLESTLVPTNFSAFGGGDTGYQIQRTDPGGFYTWHTDQSQVVDEFGRLRLLTFIWYLNTLREEDEGCTEFWDGLKVRPEEGKLLIFPASWTYVHRGCPPKVPKYICTGWVLSNVISDELPPIF